MTLINFNTLVWKTNTDQNNKITVSKTFSSHAKVSRITSFNTKFAPKKIHRSLKTIGVKIRWVGKRGLQVLIVFIMFRVSILTTKASKCATKATGESMTTNHFECFPTTLCPSWIPCHVFCKTYLLRNNTLSEVRN